MKTTDKNGYTQRYIPVTKEMKNPSKPCRVVIRESFMLLLMGSSYRNPKQRDITINEVS